MDKRLLNFMLVSMLLFIGYMEIMKRMKPPEQPDKAAAEEVADAAGGADADGNKPAEGQPTGNGDGTEGTTALAESDPTDETSTEDDATPPATPGWFTLGSLDPASGYTMLVTFNSKGAAVERIELNNPRYSDLDDKTAYIGHLALSTGPDGAKINVVGDGTPAAIAGIQVGDEITSIGEDAVSTASAAELALRKFEFGADVAIKLTRNGQSMTKTVTSMRRPLEVIRPEAYPSNDDDTNNMPGQDAGQLQPLSYLLSLYQVGHKRADFDQDEMTSLPSLRKSQWYAEQADVNGSPAIEFRFPITAAKLNELGLKGDFVAVKRFWLPRSNTSGEEDADSDIAARNYHVNFEVEFENKSSEQLEVGYRLDGPTGLPLEGWWYSYKTHPKHFFNAVGVRDIVYRAEGDAHKLITNSKIVKQHRTNPDSPEIIISDSASPLGYVGVDAQYFHSAILPAPSTGEQTVSHVFERVEAFPLATVAKNKKKRTPVTFRADATAMVIKPNDTGKQHFHIFAGPKHPDALAAYGLDECIVYGWFKVFAKFMGSLLHFLHSIVGNYGISIILLTLLVRACMLPIGRQQAKSAKMMQELAPELKKIKEKHPNDPVKAQQAQSEFMKKHNVNPLMGCLPAFLQLPIFIGLYRALSVDIELRQTPLFEGLSWCSNLAAPDMLMQWNNYIPIERLTGYTGFLGPYLNVLPLISTGLFLAHQHLFTPPPQDEQQAMQQKMMKMMMIVMVAIFFRVPAGLCLYFITSSLWALGERLLLPKDLTKKKVEEEAEKKPSLLSEAASKVLKRDTNKESVSERKKRRKKKAKK